MSLRSENAQLRNGVHALLGPIREQLLQTTRRQLGEFKKDDKRRHTENLDLRQQVEQLQERARDFVALCHKSRETLEAYTAGLRDQVEQLRAATREFVWGNGASRNKGKKAASGEGAEAPHPAKRKRPKSKAK